MVNINELRIGNILNFWRRYVKVVMVSENNIGCEYAVGGAYCSAPPLSTALNPIVLTPENIVKYGNDKKRISPHGSGYSIKIKKITWLLLLPEEGYFNVCIEQGKKLTYPMSPMGDPSNIVTSSMVDLKKIRYIHELQNLYKELSHKELTYKR